MTAAQKIAALEQARQMLDRAAELIEDSGDAEMANRVDYISYKLCNRLADLTEQEICG